MLGRQCHCGCVCCVCEWLWVWRKCLWVVEQAVGKNTVAISELVPLYCK